MRNAPSSGSSWQLNFTLLPSSSVLIHSSSGIFASNLSGRENGSTTKNLKRPSHDKFSETGFLASIPCWADRTVCQLGERACLRLDAMRSQGSTRSKRNRKETGYEKDYHSADIPEQYFQGLGQGSRRTLWNDLIEFSRDPISATISGILPSLVRI